MQRSSREGSFVHASDVIFILVSHKAPIDILNGSLNVTESITLTILDLQYLQDDPKRTQMQLKVLISLQMMMR